MTESRIKALIHEIIARETEGLRDAKKHGVNSPGFNQILGAIDGLTSLLDEIESED